MMSEPLSPQQNRFLKVVVSIMVQTCLTRLKNPSGLAEHSINSLGKNKRQALSPDSFENLKLGT